jgi:PhnB protein
MSTTNNTIVQPYLCYEGRCEEALEFYRRALGAEIEVVMRFKDAPEQGGCAAPDGTKPPGDKVMHASFRVGTTTLMASDGMCSGKAGFSGISLSYSVPTVAEAEKAFAALAEGGQVQMPLSATFFSPSFGMVADRFGVSWMVHVTPPQSQ